MKVQTFQGKIGADGLAHLDHHINDWLARHHVTPKHIHQSCGFGLHHDGRGQEPVVVISIWYEPSNAHAFELQAVEQH
jgi:hypothetical protein